MRPIIGGLVLLAWANVAAAEPARVQETWVQFSPLIKDRLDTRDDLATQRRDILLRPMKPTDGKDLFKYQEFQIYLANPTDEPREKVTVEIEGLGDPPGEKLVSEPIKLEDGSLPIRIKAWKPAAPSPAPPAAPPPGPAELPRIEKLPHVLRLRVVEETREGPVVLESREVAVDLMHPSEYIAVKSIQFSSQGEDRNQLTVQLEATRNFSGSACDVELVLTHRHIPGFLTFQQGSGAGSLKTPERPLDLVAQGLRFDSGAPRSGRVYISVDGYDRAFIYETTFEKRAGTVQPVPVRTPFIRLRDPESQGDAPIESLLDKPYPFVIEPDNLPLTTPLRVTLGEGEAKPLPGSRQRWLRTRPRGPNGGILLRGEVQDWHEQVKTEGLKGKHRLRVEAEGVEPAIGTHEIDLVEQLTRADVRIPEKLRRVPKQDKLRIEMELQVPANKPQIKEIWVYDQRLDKDGKPPEKASRRRAEAPGASGKWLAELDIPGGTAKSVGFTVELVDTNGAKTYREFTRAVPDPSGSLQVSVEGAVVPGPIGNVTVEVLAKGNPMPVATMMTDANSGIAFFSSLPPGDYTVRIAKDKMVAKDPEQLANIRVDETTTLKFEMRAK